MWRDMLQRCGSPLVAMVTAVSLPVSAYYITHARSSAQLVSELQREVLAYTVVTVGDTLPTLVGYDIHGNRLSVDLSHSHAESLIFGVSGTCIYCMNMLDSHRRLAEAAIVSGRRAYWVSRDRLVPAAASVYVNIAPEGALMVEPTNSTYRALGLGFTPQIVLVSADGIVKAVWKGVTEDKEQIESEVRRAMGLAQDGHSSSAQ